MALFPIVACASRRDDPTGSVTTPGTPYTATGVPSKAQGGNAAAPESVAENPFDGCDMCHVDVADEVIGTRHQAEAVGCVKCHGTSQGHVRDENNEVKPDRFFARQDIDAFCGGCHKCSRPPAMKPLTKPKPGRKVCTECHGAHEMLRAGQIAPS